MYISGAGQPIRPSDAFPLLLDNILGGGDVILIGDGGEERALLDRAATRLADMRSRILQASDVLPDGIRASMQSRDRADPSRSSIPDDEFLTHSYTALTVLDESCDRIVLLVGDAHALQHSALRYIQFVSRSCGHLQLVFCGTHEFLDLLEVDRFAWLRARLLAGLVVSLATPIVRVPIALPPIPFVPDTRAATVGETAAFRPGVPKSRFITSMSFRNVRLAPLALFGLGGAAWLTLCMQHGTKIGPTTSRQDLVQPATLKPLAIIAPNRQVNGRVIVGAVPETPPATPNASASHPSDMAEDAQGAGPAWPVSKPSAPRSTMVSKNLVAARPEIRSSANEPGLTEPPAPSVISTLGDRSVSAARLHALDRTSVHLPTTLESAVLPTSTRQALDVAASHPVSKAPPAAIEADPNPVVMTGAVQRIDTSPSSSVRALPSSEPASGILVAALPQSRTGLPSSETSRLPWPEAVPEQDTGQHGVSVVPLHTAATSGKRARRIRLLAKQAASLPAVDPWLAPQPVSTSRDDPQRYIGSYTTDADGVRVFRLDP